MEYSFVIAKKELNITKMYSLNSKMHWGNRAKQKAEIEMVTINAIKRADLYTATIKPPVIIKIEYNTKLDIDNHGFVTKCIIDGIKSVLLENDSRKYIISDIQQYWDGDGTRVTIIESEVDESKCTG